MKFESEEHLFDEAARTAKWVSKNFKEYKETLLPPEGTVAIQTQIYFNDESDHTFIIDEFSLKRGF